MTDLTAATAAADQMRAGARDAIDEMITSLLVVDQSCPCGHPLDSNQHIATLMGWIETQISAPTQTLMLAEALTRLAVAQKAAGA